MQDYKQNGKSQSNVIIQHYMQMNISLFLVYKLQVYLHLTVNLMIQLVLFVYNERGRILENYVGGSSVLTVCRINLLDWYALQSNINSDILKCVQQNGCDSGGKHR